MDRPFDPQPDESLRQDWLDLRETGSAVQHALDMALYDLSHDLPVGSPPESYDTASARIDQAIDGRVTPYRDLPWAVAAADALRRQLKDGLRRTAPAEADS